VYHVTDHVSVWGDVSSGFRAPTLNELYRQFKKGTTTTLANYTLVPERLVAGEGGVSVTVASHLTVRATGFTNRVRNPVTNVTITTPVTPASLPTATATCTPSASQICVQRQNVGQTVIEGIQTDVEYRLGDFRVTAAYLHESAKVRENTSNTALVGNVLPEVPKNRGSVQIAYANRRIAAVSLDVQAVGAQFDDDLNTPTRVLPSYKVANVSLSRAIGRNIDIYFDVQNMFNVVYNVATLPTTIGSPRIINGGIRVRFSGQ
jgi:outer membrane receptor protein involved in Fe transport